MSAEEIIAANGSLANPPTQSDNLHAVKEQVESIANHLAEELRQRFEDPEKVKEALAQMSTGDILEWCMKIMRALKTNQVVIPGQFHVNLQQVNNYATQMAESQQKRNQLRSAARKQLKHKPS